MYTLLTKYGVSAVVDGYNVGFPNSLIGRAELKELNLPATEYAEIMVAWGDEPTVFDPPEEPINTMPSSLSYGDQLADIRAQQLAIMEALAETYEMLLGGMTL